MVPASCKMSGTCLAVPDVCKTPSPGGPVPLPYPNTAMAMQASKTSTKVKISGKDAIVEGSEIPMSSGDEAGSIGGVSSNQIKGKVTFKKGSSKVKAQGKSVCYIGSMTSHNGSSANMPAGAQIAPSQVKVIVGM
jgi:uncharacterized Zn-binding protein involved in type VI secretion